MLYMNTLSKPSSGLSKRKLKLIRDEMIVANTDYRNTLLKRALYKTNDIEASKDLVQNTFLKTLLYLQKGGQN